MLIQIEWTYIKTARIITCCLPFATFSHTDSNNMYNSKTIHCEVRVDIMSEIPKMAGSIALLLWRGHWKSLHCSSFVRVASSRINFIITHLHKHDIQLLTSHHYHVAPLQQVRNNNSKPLSSVIKQSQRTCSRLPSQGIFRSPDVPSSVAFTEIQN